MNTWCCSSKIKLLKITKSVTMFLVLRHISKWTFEYPDKKVGAGSFVTYYSCYLNVMHGYHLLRVKAHVYFRRRSFCAMWT